MMETIFNGRTVILAYGDVQHIEKHWYQGDEVRADNYRGVNIITNKTKWSLEIDNWANPVYLERQEADKFIEGWLAYRKATEPFPMPMPLPVMPMEPLEPNTPFVPNVPGTPVNPFYPYPGVPTNPYPGYPGREIWYTTSDTDSDSFPDPKVIKLNQQDDVP